MSRSPRKAKAKLGVSNGASGGQGVASFAACRDTHCGGKMDKFCKSSNLCYYLMIC